MLGQEEMVRVQVLDDAVEIEFWNPIDFDESERVDFLEGALLACLTVLL